MLANQAPASNGSPQGDSDYDSILAALMETARGRWFLREYARRNRAADTATLLMAIERIENLLRSRVLDPSESPVARSEASGLETMPADRADTGRFPAGAAETESGAIEIAEVEIVSAFAARDAEAATSDGAPAEAKRFQVAAVEFLGPELPGPAPVDLASRAPVTDDGRDPFADIRALSDEEKIALFT